MSIRRRAIRARVEREDKFLKQWKLQDDALKAILALVQRKIAAADTTVTAEELQSCMPPHPTVSERGYHGHPATTGNYLPILRQGRCALSPAV